jgi:hypothetical protein
MTTIEAPMDPYQATKATSAAPLSKIFHSQTAQHQSKQHVGDVTSQVIIFLAGNGTDNALPSHAKGKLTPVSAHFSKSLM